VFPKNAPPDAFGRAARDYELGRPEWPEKLLDDVCEAAGVGPDSEVLDLAAGTGKLTRLLVKRFANVVAVEPDDAMRALLDEVAPHADSRAGNAEAIPLGDDSVDCVFCAEAFHWFPRREVLDEVARVLKPHGALVLVCNIPAEEIDPPFSEEADRLMIEAVERGSTSVSSVAVQPDEDRQAFADRLRELLTAKTYRRNIRVDAYWTRLTG
jgi:ubiquinone/menaquinone biosynthesis C-methylase UbiE